MIDPDEHIADLERDLLAHPPGVDPIGHATIQLSLGIALSEHPACDGLMLRKAVGSFSGALKIFDAVNFPLERARVLIALGSTERTLGMTVVAIDRFRSAADLVGAESPADLGSALNNLGLALAEAGRTAEAETVFQEALGQFDVDKFGRQRATTLYNYGQLLTALGRTPDAVEAFTEAVEAVTPDRDGPVWATISHALGVSLVRQESDLPEVWKLAERHLSDALTIFTRRMYPMQHAMAMHNLGLSLASRPSASSVELRRALACFEDALSLLDVRMHPGPRQEATISMERVLDLLEDLGYRRDRAIHFANLVAETTGHDRRGILRSRLHRIFETPEPGRSSQLAELDRALVRLPDPALGEVSVDWMTVLTEDRFEAAHDAFASRVAAINELPEPQRSAAAAGVELAIGQLEVLIRMQVRDMLESMGYERPR